MLSDYATNEINKWMHWVVVISASGSRVVGYYDGYGRVGGWDINDSGDPCCWHHACWLKAGKPDTFEASDYALDQGYFFDEGAHDMEEPQ